jgi:hypothetical protein
VSQSESFLKQWKKVRYWSQDEKSDGAAYNSKKKVNRLRNKTARKGAIGFYLFVALWGSRTANWSQLFL